MSAASVHTPRQASHQAPAIFDSLESPRRPLPFTIRGELGFREGEIWKVSDRRLAFWSSERQTPNNTYDARVDLRGHGGNLDLVVKIIKVRPCRAGRLPGFLHLARYRAASATAAQRLCEIFGGLNPDRVSGPSAMDSMPGQPVPPPRPRQVEPHSQPAPAPRQPARPQRQQAAAPQPAPPPPPPPNPPPRGGPRRPPPVVPQNPNPPTPKRSRMLERGDLFIYAAPEPTLQRQQGVTMHLQLPQGLFLSLQGRVVESNRLRSVFVARRIEPAAMNTLTAALEQPVME